MWTFIKKLFGLQRSDDVNQQETMKKFLIVGLGNIGADYINTRHNIGFKMLNHYAKSNDLSFEDKKLGKLALHKIKGRQLFLLKPNTYMNLSGKAVKYWLEKEKIPLENLLVITDDLNLEFDTIRLKGKGSAGGHNGLKDIQDKLQTTSYNRLRYGISNNYRKGGQVDYVLGKWSDEEMEVIKNRLDISNKIIESFVLQGVANTMNQFNGK